MPPINSIDPFKQGASPQGNQKLQSRVERLTRKVAQDRLVIQALNERQMQLGREITAFKKQISDLRLGLEIESGHRAIQCSVFCFILAGLAMLIFTHGLKVGGGKDG